MPLKWSYVIQQKQACLQEHAYKQRTETGANCFIQSVIELIQAVDELTHTICNKYACSLRIRTSQLFVWTWLVLQGKLQFQNMYCFQFELQWFHNLNKVVVARLSVNRTSTPTSNATWASTSASASVWCSRGRCPDQCVSLRILLETKQFGARGVIVQNQFYSKRIRLKRNKFRGGGVAFQTECVWGPIENQFWFGSLTVQRKRFPQGIWNITNKFRQEALPSRINAFVC